MATQHQDASEVRWSLDDLYDSTEALQNDLSDADRAADEFAERYRGRIGELGAEALAEALSTLAGIQERLGRARAYAHLHWSTDTNDAERGALLQSVRETVERIQQKLVFVETEWTALDDERAEALLAHDALDEYQHYLETEFLRKDHILSEEEEKVLSEKSITGKDAWTRFFDETLGAARFELNGEELTQEEILSKLYEPNRRLRRTAALAFTDGLKERKRALTFVFNTLLADKASTDRLRGYDHWLESRNLSNEVDDATVETLIDAVTGRYDLVARFYRLKKQLLGLDELYDYDRYAPVREADTEYEWHEARALVLHAYEDFHPDMAQAARRFFDDEWIDAALAPGKRSGAFSHGVVPSAHPYVLLNYTGKARDVQTLAHELGHGVHQSLAREQNIFHHGTPLTTAEMASVFGEMLVFQRLMEQEDDPSNRLAMLVAKIDDTLATVFRQVAMNRFEHRIHTARREHGELTPDRFAEHWMATQEAMFDGSVTLGDHYRHWWSYIPHFLHTPGYVYAYAFGELLVLALHARYEEADAGFADQYLDLLRAGGADWPHVLVGQMGVDLTDDDFWQKGLSQIETLIEQAEALAGQTPDRVPRGDGAPRRS
ncbi:MAG: M3 family oligoendopeptidase [Salinibacter sp.]|uniref:M3 family oligoendopeptidase n=1 Tax=Salinibacter sp. TaxID=2065818 RepID=UPI0035D475F4